MKVGPGMVSVPHIKIDACPINFSFNTVEFLRAVIIEGRFVKFSAFFSCNFSYFHIFQILFPNIRMRSLPKYFAPC